MIALAHAVLGAQTVNSCFFRVQSIPFRLLSFRGNSIVRSQLDIHHSSGMGQVVDLIVVHDPQTAAPTRFQSECLTVEEYALNGAHHRAEHDEADTAILHPVAGEMKHQFGIIQ